MPSPPPSLKQGVRANYENSGVSNLKIQELVLNFIIIGIKWYNWENVNKYYVDFSEKTHN